MSRGRQGTQSSDRYGKAPRWPRWRYGRRLIWEGRDDWGIVEVVASPLGAALHFGNIGLQGRLCLDEPWRPIAEYAITMAGVAAFPAPQPRASQPDLPRQPQVCLLGLGTGSLAWSYHRLLPHAELTAFELRPAVIDAAYACFRLSEISPLKVVEGDASDLISTLPERSQTIIAIDLFNESGMVDLLQRGTFWRQVSRALHPSGVLCLNAWSGQADLFNRIIDHIERWVSPGGIQVGVSHEGFGNVVIFATPRPYHLDDVLKRAHQVDQILSQGRKWSRKQLQELIRVGINSENIAQRLSRAQLMKKLTL